MVESENPRKPGPRRADDEALETRGVEGPTNLGSRTTRPGSPTNNTNAEYHVHSLS